MEELEVTTKVQVLEEMLMQNNAILQVMLENQAFTMQFLSDIYAELYLHRVGRLPSDDTPSYRERIKMAKEKIEIYKLRMSELFQNNIKIVNDAR
jgi:hypothetical protein